MYAIYSNGNRVSRFFTSVVDANLALSDPSLAYKPNIKVVHLQYTVVENGWNLKESFVTREDAMVYVSNIIADFAAESFLFGVPVSITYSQDDTVVYMGRSEFDKVDRVTYSILDASGNKIRVKFDVEDEPDYSTLRRDA